MQSMASGRKKKDDNAGGLGGFLTFLGGAAAGAALAYGAVKLVDYFQAPNLEQPSTCANDPYYSETEHYNNVSGYADEKANDLHEELWDYYRNYVDKSEKSKSYVLGFVSEIAKKFREHFSAAFDSEFIRVQRSKPIEFARHEDVLFPSDAKQNLQITVFISVELSRQHWKIVDENGLKNVTCSSNFCDPNLIDRLTGTLNPSKVLDMINATLKNNSTMWKESNKSWEGTYIGNCALCFVCTEWEKQPAWAHPVNIKFIPVLDLEGSNWIATTDNRSGWQRSFWFEERSSITQISGSSHVWCLTVLDSVCKNFSTELGIVNQTILLNLFLHVAKTEDEWGKEAFTERFIDLLKALEDYLHAGQLPSYFLPKCNLLEGYHATELNRAVQFISQHIGQDNIHGLLKLR